MTARATTILFWLSIVLVGVVLWKMVSTHGRTQQTVKYSEFLGLIEKSEIRSVTLYLEKDEVQVVALPFGGKELVEVSVPDVVLPELIRKLGDKGIPFDFKRSNKSDWVLILINAAPLFLLVGFCFYLLRSMRSGQMATKLAIARALGVQRFGLGYDLHRLAEGRKLIVGGVEIPFDKGPVGHSDGDVLAHAICDALLGAGGAGDIGTLFPDTDPQWKGVSSLLFLEQVRKVLKERNLSVAHVDAVVITEKPKLGPHFRAMKEALAKALDIKPAQISLKAKTNEGVDAIGHGEAIAAHAVATLVGT